VEEESDIRRRRVDEKEPRTPCTFDEGRRVRGVEGKAEGVEGWMKEASAMKE
jgi:hypothetical protein